MKTCERVFSQCIFRSLKKKSCKDSSLRGMLARSDLADITDERVGQSWITRPIGDEQAVIF